MSCSTMCMSYLENSAVTVSKHNPLILVSLPSCVGMRTRYIPRVLTVLSSPTPHNTSGPFISRLDLPFFSRLNTAPFLLTKSPQPLSKNKLNLSRLFRLFEAYKLSFLTRRFMFITIHAYLVLVCIRPNSIASWQCSCMK